MEHTRGIERRMGDLISKSAIKYTYTDVRGDDGHMWTVPCVGKDEIDEMPTIDAVPVVRCKDCKFWQQATQNSGYCSMGFAPTAYADDFCSFGERREDATD